MQVTSGLSFCIPSNFAKQFVDKYSHLGAKEDSGKEGGGVIDSFFGRMKTPREKRMQLGIQMLELDPQVIKELQFRNWDFPNVSHGVLVHTVVVESPAHVSGIYPGDVLTHVNGKEIHTGHDVMNALKSGEDITFTVARSEGNEKIKIDFGS